MELIASALDAFRQIQGIFDVYSKVPHGTSYSTLLYADKHLLQIFDLGTDQLGKRKVVEPKRGYGRGNERWILLHACHLLRRKTVGDRCRNRERRGPRKPERH